MIWQGCYPDQMASTRNPDGTFKPGVSGNPQGRRRFDSVLPGGEPTPPTTGTPVPLSNVATQVIEAQMRADSWSSMLTGIGTALDKRTSHRFKRTCLTYQEAMDLWASDDMAARAVELVPAECFSKGYEINISDEGSFTDLKEQVEQKLLDWKVDEVIERAMRYERAYGGAAIVKYTEDNASLDEPIDDSDAKLETISVFEPIEIYPDSNYTNPSDPKYGKTLFYRIGASAAAWGTNTTGNRVPPPNTMLIHESRVIPFGGIRVSNFQPIATMTNSLWGDSVFIRMVEVLRDFDIGWSGVGLIATDVSQPVITIEGLMTRAARHGQEVHDRMLALQMGRSTARAILLDAKEKFERQTTNLNGVPELLDRLSQRLAAAIGVPLSMLFGSASGLGQPGQNDLDIWRDGIRSLQRRKVGPLIRQFALMAMNEVRKRKLPKKWKIEFNALQTQTVGESSESRRTQAQTDSMMIKAGVLSPDEVRKARYGGGYSYDTPIQEAKKAPGFIAPLPAGLMSKAMSPEAVTQAIEAGEKSGVAGAAQPVGPAAHQVGGYVRKNPTAPALGADPAQGGDKAPTLRDAADLTRVTFSGLLIVIENPKGSTRNWTDSTGETGSTRMRYDYGYIDGSLGNDGDCVDCYLGPNEQAPWVYVIHQQSKASGFTKYDEDKSMLGFDSANHAKDAYENQYDDPRFYGGMSVMSVDDFTRRVMQGAGQVTHGDLDEFAIVEHLDRIEHRGSKWYVLAETGDQVLGEYSSEEEAIHRLAQIEYFTKHAHKSP